VIGAARGRIFPRFCPTSRNGGSKCLKLLAPRSSHVSNSLPGPTSGDAKAFRAVGGPTQGRLREPGRAPTSRRPRDRGSRPPAPLRTTFTVVASTSLPAHATRFLGQHPRNAWEAASSKGGRLAVAFRVLAETARGRGGRAATDVTRATSMTTSPSPRRPLPPFDRDAAIQKVRLGEDARNTRDPQESQPATPRTACGAIARSFSPAERRSFSSWRGSGPGNWTID